MKGGVIGTMHRTGCTEDTGCHIHLNNRDGILNKNLSFHVAVLTLNSSTCSPSSSPSQHLLPLGSNIQEF